MGATNLKARGHVISLAVPAATSRPSGGVGEEGGGRGAQAVKMSICRTPKITTQYSTHT